MKNFRGEALDTFYFWIWSNFISGTDGQSTFPFIDKNKRIEIYVSDICRNIYMEYERDDIYRGPNGDGK